MVSPVTADSAAAAPDMVVGLYGSAGQLQFDISRLPRVDQYQAVVSSNSQLGVVDIPSDIKTVTYFLRSSDSAAESSGPVNALSGGPQPSTTGQGSGLMRRELDRAVSVWAEGNGSTSATYADAQMLAEEVTSLQFQYFDGTQWLADWNSDEAGGLPTAVEIIMAIQPGLADAAAESDSAAPLPPAQIFRQVVHLPIAKPIEATTEAAP
jgi:hypothetical protein